MAITKKDIKELIDKYTDRITYIDSKENPEEYSRFETEVLDDVITDLENLLNKKGGLKAVLENTPETKQYLEKLRKIYLIGRWAHYGVREYPFSGKYSDKNEDHPLVYDYDDHNGTCDNYFLKDLYETTTGYIWGWTFSKKDAERIANNLEKKNEEKAWS